MLFYEIQANKSYLKNINILKKRVSKYIKRFSLREVSMIFLYDEYLKIVLGVTVIVHSAYI